MTATFRSIDYTILLSVSPLRDQCFQRDKYSQQHIATFVCCSSFTKVKNRCGLPTPEILWTLTPYWARVSLYLFAISTKKILKKAKDFTLLRCATSMKGGLYFGAVIKVPFELVEIVVLTYVAKNSRFRFIKPRLKNNFQSYARLPGDAMGFL